MKSIGIRVEPKEIIYTIMSEDGFSIQSLTLPKALNNDVPRQLSFIRTTLFSLICEYQIEYAGLRTAEGNAQTLNLFRINVEGVIQELFSDSTVKKYFAGTLTSIGSRLGKKSTEIKDCRDGKFNFFNVEGWDRLNPKKRESYLAALAVLPRDEDGEIDD